MDQGGGRNADRDQRRDAEGSEALAGAQSEDARLPGRASRQGVHFHCAAAAG